LNSDAPTTIIPAMIRENPIAINHSNAESHTPSPALRAAARLGAVLVFVLLTSAAAAVRYPVPGSPVPATLQTLAVLACGLLLGPWLGSASMALYLALGLMGLPVFASGSAAKTIPAATAGYLAAFVIVQPILGRIVTSERRSPWRLLAALLTAQAIIFLLGVAWLKIASASNWTDALRMGFWPFVPVDALLKTIAAVLVGAALVGPVRRALALR
jgi:biotin transport system substrate-specific component